MSDWTYTKCNCGDEICDKYFLSFTGSDGRVTLEEAKLICAATDLLEACKAVAEGDWSDAADWKDAHAQLVALCRAAIAKAT